VFDFSLPTLGIYLVVSVLLVSALPIVAMSIIRIGPNEVGLVLEMRCVPAGTPLAARTDFPRFRRSHWS